MANDGKSIEIVASTLLTPSWCYLDENGREIEEDLEMVVSRDYTLSLVFLLYSCFASGISDIHHSTTPFSCEETFRALLHNCSN